MLNSENHYRVIIWKVEMLFLQFFFTHSGTLKLEASTAVFVAVIQEKKYIQGALKHLAEGLT